MTQQLTHKIMASTFYNSNLNSNDDIYDAINEQFCYDGHSAMALMEALQDYFHGELVAASDNAADAISEGFLPFAGKQFAGSLRDDSHEYHHFAFRNEAGETFVEAVPFDSVANVEAMYN